jgi:hypothetical protein
MTTHSLIPMASRHTGVDMAQLCSTLVREAMRRVRTVRADSTLKSSDKQFS